MIEFFATQLTTGLAELDYLGHQKAICQAEQDLGLAIGRTEPHAYWHVMERGTTAMYFVNRELQEEIGKTSKKREHIDEKARAIRDAMAELML